MASRLFNINAALIFLALFVNTYAQNACHPNPCRNGFCTANGYNFNCLCSEGYTGKRCDQLISHTVQPYTHHFITTNPCSSSPCLYGGTCVNIPNANVNPPFACVCPSGRTGLRCETSAIITGNHHNNYIINNHNNNNINNNNNHCLSSPCNFGTCLPNQQSGGYTCVCNTGYTGLTCNTKTNYHQITPVVQQNSCNSYPCRNGGTCHNYGSSFTCTCPVHYTGATCSYVTGTVAPSTNACATNQCFYGGTCVSNSYHSYTCICQVGYTGQRCETSNQRVDGCLSNPCHQGTCLPNQQTGGFTCLCNNGYSGTYCNQQSIITSHTVAPLPYTIAPHNPCSSNPCRYGGTCIPNAGNYASYVCFCNLGYVGTHCEQIQHTTSIVHTTVAPHNPCSRNPCINSGYCVPNTNYGTYYCICTSSYFGTNCEQFITTTTARPNPCYHNPCRNGGSCYPNANYNSYTCTCPAGFSGFNCESHQTVPPVTNPCYPNPCRNSGQCVPNTQYNTFQCVCPTNYFGTYCDQYISQTTLAPINNICSPSPCLNGGVCVAQTYNTFTCVCPANYQGTTCQYLITTPQPNGCSPNPCFNGENDYNACFNGGTCTIKYTETQYTVFCECPSGYSGSRCQILSNENFNNCFCRNNGVCQKDGTCRCLADFFGIKCEFDFSVPVANATTVAPLTCPAGLCVNGDCKVTSSNSYFCYCNSGWTGVRCDVRINICQSSNPCVNGICTSEKNTNVYTCACFTGFSGINCQKGGPATEAITYTSPNSLNACQGFECLNGGTCYLDAQLAPACQCERGYIGFSCETDTCLQERLLGTCHNSIIRYYYNSATKTCAKFTYSGCNGNENNFEDLASCNKQCSGH